MSVNQIASEDQIDKEALLRRLPIFAGLGHEVTSVLAGLSRVASFPAGDEIIEEGAEILEDEDGLYLLIDGTVEVRKGSSDGEDGNVLATFGPGEFFGEMALLDGFPRSASVFALTDALCLILTRWDFYRVLRSNPEIAMKMLATMSHRLRRTSQDAVLSEES